MMGYVAHVLNAAAKTIARPGRWTQGASARDRTGKEVLSRSPKAVCWCALGAIGRAASSLGQSPYVSVREFEAFIESEVSDWNDALGRTQAEVVQALRDAAKAQGAKA